MRSISSRSLSVNPRAQLPCSDWSCSPCLNTGFNPKSKQITSNLVCLVRVSPKSLWRMRLSARLSCLTYRVVRLPRVFSMPPVPPVCTSLKFATSQMEIWSRSRPLEVASPSSMMFSDTSRQTCPSSVLCHKPRQFFPVARSALCCFMYEERISAPLASSKKSSAFTIAAYFLPLATMKPFVGSEPSLRLTERPPFSLTLSRTERTTSGST